MTYYGGPVTKSPFHDFFTCTPNQVAKELEEFDRLNSLNENEIKTPAQMKNASKPQAIPTKTTNPATPQTNAPVAAKPQ